MPCGYRAIPCVVLLVDNVVKYVGNPREPLREALELALKEQEEPSSQTEVVEKKVDVVLEATALEVAVKED